MHVPREICFKKHWGLQWDWELLVWKGGNCTWFALETERGGWPQKRILCSLSQCIINQTVCILRQWGPSWLIHGGFTQSYLRKDWSWGELEKFDLYREKGQLGSPWADFTSVIFPHSMVKKKWKLQITCETRWWGSTVREKELVPCEKEVRIKSTRKKKYDNSSKKPTSLWKEMWEKKCFKNYSVWTWDFQGPLRWGRTWFLIHHVPGKEHRNRRDARFLGKPETT